MTDIKSAIDHYRDVCVQMGQYPESDTYRYAELAIRSLQSWEEVLQELKLVISGCDLMLEDANNPFYEGKKMGYLKAIDIINQKLAEIEEVR